MAIRVQVSRCRLLTCEITKNANDFDSFCDLDKRHEFVPTCYLCNLIGTTILDYKDNR